MREIEEDAVNPAVVWRYDTVGEAGSASSALDAAGIGFAVLDENIIVLNWLYSNAVGGVKLMVRREDLEEAFEILSTSSREATADEEVTDPLAPEPEQQPAVCPSCGGAAFARIPRLKIFAALALVAFGVGVAINQPGLALALAVSVALILAFVPSHRCTNCGERWNAPEPAESVIEPPPPTASDRTERHCRRCGSLEVHRIYYRRLKAIPLYFTFTIFVVAPVCLLLPRRRCDQCGLRTYF